MPIDGEEIPRVERRPRGREPKGGETPNPSSPTPATPDQHRPAQSPGSVNSLAGLYRWLTPVPTDPRLAQTPPTDPRLAQTPGSNSSVGRIPGSSSSVERRLATPAPVQDLHWLMLFSRKQEEIESERENRSIALAELERLRIDLERSQLEIKQLHSKCNDYETWHVCLEQQLAVLQATNSELYSKCNAYELRCEWCEKEVATLQGTNGNLGIELSELKAKDKELISQIGNIKAELEATWVDRDAMRELIGIAQAEDLKRQQTIEDLQTEKIAMQDEIGIAQQTIEEVDAERDAMREQIGIDLAEELKHQRTIENLQVERNSMQEQIMTAQAKEVERQQTIECLLLERDTLREQIEIAQVEELESQQIVEELEAEGAAMREQIGVDLREEMELRHMIEDLQAERNAMRVQIGAACAENLERQQTIDCLQPENDLLKKQHRNSLVSMLYDMTGFLTNGESPQGCEGASHALELTELGNDHFGNRYWAEALSAFQSALEVCQKPGGLHDSILKRIAHLHGLCALCYSAQEEWGHASSESQKAIKLDPEYRSAHVLLIQANQRLGVSITEDCEKLGRLDPTCSVKFDINMHGWAVAMTEVSSMG